MFDALDADEQRQLLDLLGRIVEVFRARSASRWPAQRARRGCGSTGTIISTARARDSYRPRAGDVIISTSYKSGTTWMQRIMSLLVFGASPLPEDLAVVAVARPSCGSTRRGDLGDRGTRAPALHQESTCRSTRCCTTPTSATSGSARRATCSCRSSTTTTRTPTRTSCSRPATPRADPRRAVPRTRASSGGPWMTRGWSAVGARRLAVLVAPLPTPSRAGRSEICPTCWRVHYIGSHRRSRGEMRRVASSPASTCRRRLAAPIEGRASSR